MAILKRLDSFIRNFVWMGNIETRKIATFSWDKVCTPISAYGLSMEKTKSINNVRCLTLGWKVTTNQLWASTLWNKYFKNKKPIKRPISSSIYFGLKHTLNNIEDHSMGKIENDNGISFWHDNRLCYILKDFIFLPNQLK